MSDNSPPNYDAATKDDKNKVITEQPRSSVATTTTDSHNDSHKQTNCTCTVTCCTPNCKE